MEKTVLPGGLATSGLVFLYLPLCDGNGHQVSFGIAEELLHLSMKYGPGRVPEGWRDARNAQEEERYHALFSPASFVLALDEVLEKADVHMWFDSLVVGPVMDGPRVTGVEVEGKGGRMVVKCSCVVDATGDADVAYRAGTLCADGGNMLSVWALQASLEKAAKAVKESDGAMLMDLVSLGDEWSRLKEASAKHERLGTDVESVTAFVLDGRRLLREHYRRLHGGMGGEGRHAVYPLVLPTMAQFRMTRRIAGRTTMRPGEGNKYVADSVGMCPDWRAPGPVWEVPYGALVPESVEGLLVAGRCMAAEGDAWDVMRVIPSAAVTGQAAGLAAALAAGSGITPGDIGVSELQAGLRRRGISLHRDELAS